MKIDIHAHTKKIKTGDSTYRNIDVTKFTQIIKSTDVKIIALTNHNHFDYEQFKQFSENTEEYCQIWPGVELDISEENRRGHLIVIVNPKNAKTLSEKMNGLMVNTSEEKFSISIENTIRIFDSLDAIYIAHYNVKKPDLMDEDINKITSQISKKNRVIKEATNSLSAGIYISHGHLSIYGSDVQNWDDYVTISKNLPDLRLPVESFEQFCLLLEKDEPTINTILDQKKHEQISITPFGKDETITLNVFNDINILFGSKGTGKTEILKAISRAYNEKGLKTKVYEASSEHLNDHFDIKGTKLEINLKDFGIHDCSKEISFIKKISEINITSISNYKNYFSEKTTNARAKKLKISDLSILDSNTPERKFTEIEKIRAKILEFDQFIYRDKELKKIIGEELITELVGINEKIMAKINSERETRFIESKSVKLFNSLITLFTSVISRKTGKPEKPTTTGFLAYSRNRINIERNINVIIENLNKDIPYHSIYVGNLGEKGELYCKTEIIIQKGDLSDGNFITYNNIKKNPQKDFSKAILQLQQKIYTDDFFERLADFLSNDGIESINNISDLILFYKYFSINEIQYTPSSGESSMLLLHKELREEKDIYLLDEPEKSLGNDYINDVIVPLLKNHAKMGKKIFIATHDANIAVRTLPYNSIYRKHNADNYATYIGNPFSNYLIHIDNHDDQIDWKEISMKTLEGGREAFGERGKIYGNL